MTTNAIATARQRFIERQEERAKNPEPLIVAEPTRAKPSTAATVQRLVDEGYRMITASRISAGCSINITATGVYLTSQARLALRHPKAVYVLTKGSDLVIVPATTTDTDAFSLAETGPITAKRLRQALAEAGWAQGRYRAVPETGQLRIRRGDKQP